MYTACYHLITFIHGESKIWHDYGSNVPTPLYVQSNTNWNSATCIIEQLSPIIIASDWTISQNWNFELKCDIELKNGWPHTITIEDPLYDSTNSPSLWQITDINIWLTEPTRMMENWWNKLHYRNEWNAKSIEYLN